MGVQAKHVSVSVCVCTTTMNPLSFRDSVAAECRGWTTEDCEAPEHFVCGWARVVRCGTSDQWPPIYSEGPRQPCPPDRIYSVAARVAHFRVDENTFSVGF